MIVPRCHCAVEMAVNIICVQLVLVYFASFGSDYTVASVVGTVDDFQANLTNWSKPPMLTGIRTCEDYDEASSICLYMKFSKGAAGSMPVACKAYDQRQDNTPSPIDIVFGSTGSAASFVKCELPGVCKVLLQSGIQPASTYYTFCAEYVFDVRTIPPVGPTVQPQCKPSNDCGLLVRTSEGANTHTKAGAIDLAGTVLLMVYISWSYFFERVPILHETGASALVGLLAGVLFLWWFKQTATFSYNTFSFFLLPAVIFGAGFNLQKKDFFQFSSYIMSLGVIGTVLIFFFIFYGSALIDFFAQDGTRIDLSARHRLIMASVLASTDSVAPMAFLPQGSFPMLYAVVFGEGVINDVMSILLSTAVADSTSVPDVGTLLYKILYYFFTSGFVGVVAGFGTSYIFKRASVLHEEVTKPTVLLLIANYSCYVVAEMCDFSSIFALFVCALLCGHYAKYSISEKACQFASELAELMGYMAEAFVFGYFGLTAVSYTRHPSKFSPKLIMFFSLSILLARFVAVALLAIFIRLLRGGRLRVTLQEICVITLAGCMRGTIAYALILRSMPTAENQSVQQTVLITTVLGIVLLNSVVFGGLFPIVLKLLGLKPDGCQPNSEGADTCERRTSPHALSHVLLNWRALDQHYLKPIFRARAT